MLQNTSTNFHAQPIHSWWQWRSCSSFLTWTNRVAWTLKVRKLTLSEVFAHSLITGSRYLASSTLCLTRVAHPWSEFLDTYVQCEYGVRELAHCNPMQVSSTRFASLHLTASFVRRKRMKLTEDLRVAAGAAKVGVGSAWGVRVYAWMCTVCWRYVPFARSQSTRLRDVALDLAAFARHVDACAQLGGGLVVRFQRSYLSWGVPFCRTEKTGVAATTGFFQSKMNMNAICQIGKHSLNFFTAGFLGQSLLSPHRQ